MEGKTTPDENVLSISKWRRKVSDNKTITAQTPPEVATEFEHDAETALKLVT
jgi:hypothetical protein